MLLVKTKVGPSAIHGLGLFAAEGIPRGTPIWRFEPGLDQDFTPAQAATLPELTQAHLRWFGYINRDTGHCILSGDHACFMNHSDASNTGAPFSPTPPVTTVALRDISAGEEITCDYHAFDGDAGWKLRDEG